MSEYEKEAWNAFIKKLEQELAKLKADVAHFETSSVELRKAPQASASEKKETSLELSRFKQAIANMEAVIEEHRQKAK